MNKKRDTSTKHNKNKKRCKRKIINDKKWERPAGYYKEYETRRMGEGHTTRLRIKALAACCLKSTHLPLLAGCVVLVTAIHSP